MLLLLFLRNFLIFLLLPSRQPWQERKKKGTKSIGLLNINLINWIKLHQLDPSRRNSESLAVRRGRKVQVSWMLVQLVVIHKKDNVQRQQIFNQPFADYITFNFVNWGHWISKQSVYTYKNARTHTICLRTNNRSPSMIAKNYLIMSNVQVAFSTRLYCLRNRTIISDGRLRLNRYKILAMTANYRRNN